MGTYSRYPWLNTVEYPFATREFDAGEGWMSYVDTGQGRPIVFVHGSMTWSFLYRKMIEELYPHFRCIAPDNLGFGLSDKPHEADYRPEAHAERFAKLMDFLRLTDVTLVLHDYGGPIGLNWAADNPDRVRDIVCFNTWLWDLTDNDAAMRLAKMIGNKWNQQYYRLLQATPSFILPPLFADRHRMTKAIQQQYLKPYPHHFDRTGVYRMVESWQKSGAFFDSVAAKADRLAHKRMLAIWGLKDPLFGEPALKRFLQIFPHAESHAYADCGRFIPEEKAERATGELRWFLLNSGVAEGIIAEIGH